MKRLLYLLPLLLLLLMGVTRRSCVIIDGNRTLYYQGSAATPEEILEDARISLRDGDRWSFDGSTLTVKRLQSVRVDFDGQTKLLRSYGETVASLLRRCGFAERFRPDCDARLPTFDGMEINLRSVQSSTEHSAVELPPPTLYLCTDRLPPGETLLLCGGSPGLLRSMDAVTYENGKETSRVTVMREISEGRKARIVLVGTDSRLHVHTEPHAAHSVTLAGRRIAYERALRVEATAYCCEGYTGITATGTVARVGAIAVDPKVIPYGTEMYIVSDDGAYVYGYATAEDCGAFRGNRIDLYFDTEEECFTFGRRACTVYIIC